MKQNVFLWNTVPSIPLQFSTSGILGPATFWDFKNAPSPVALVRLSTNSFPYYRWAFPDGGTYRLVLHAGKDDVEHLCERGLGRGLVNEVLAGQVDVVTGADGLQDGALMDFYVLWGDCC